MNDTIGDLNWKFDNYPVQNKNRMVIQFFVYLTERGFFLKVNLIFLVKGHKKKICDRIFNLLKLGYNNKNIYPTDESMEMLNTHDQLTAIKVNELTDFHDWDAIFEDLYRRPSGLGPHLASVAPSTKNTFPSYGYYRVLGTAGVGSGQTGEDRRMGHGCREWERDDRSN